MLCPQCHTKMIENVDVKNVYHCLTCSFIYKSRAPRDNTNISNNSLDKHVKSKQTKSEYYC